MEEKVLKILEEINDEIPGYTGDNMFDDDLIDSLSVIDIVAELEDAFGIEIDAKYVVEDNFKTVSAITELVRKLIGK